MTVENELKVYRAKHDITQQELAADVGVSRQTINAVETGKYNPSLELALNISDRFCVSVEDLFYFDDNS